MATKKVAKKTVPKKAAKKTVKKMAPKKTVKKVSNAKSKKNAVCKECSITVAPQEKCFWVYNGPVVDTLAHLLEAVEYMSQEQYAYHVRGKENDFAAWVRDVLECDSCADALLKTRSKSGMVQVLKSVCK